MSRRIIRLMLLMGRSRRWFEEETVHGLWQEVMRSVYMGGRCLVGNL